MKAERMHSRQRGGDVNGRIVMRAEEGRESDQAVEVVGIVDCACDMISTLSLVFLMYAHGSEYNLLNPLASSFLFNSIFHSRPDCFSPYNVFISFHSREVPSSYPSGWSMKTSSFRIPFR